MFYIEAAKNPFSALNIKNYNTDTVKIITLIIDTLLGMVIDIRTLPNTTGKHRDSRAGMH